MLLSTSRKSGCGCISGQFITAARSKFSRALVDAGTELENFVTWIKILPHHARDEHEWEDVECDRPMSRGLSCLSIAKLKQLKRKKSRGSLNIGVQTKKNERAISKGSAFI